jgi:hypothetical protein
MGEVSRINLKLDRKTFQVVLATFSFMRDSSDPTIMDFAAMFISPQDVSDIVDKLQSSDLGCDPVTISMNFDDWTVFSGLLLHTSAKIPQTDSDAYEILDALSDECGRLDDAREAPIGPEQVRSWQLLSDAEKTSVAVQIDSQDSFNNYGANAGTIMKVSLSFYPGAQLLRVASLSPAVGSRYFIQHENELIPLHRLGDIQTFCDDHFGVRLRAGFALDYFRFAHFFSDEGLRTYLVECPQFLGMYPATYHPGKRKAAAFIKPPEIQIDEAGLMVTACTFAERESRLYRDSYRLTPCQPLQLLKREDSGLDLGSPFLDRQLKIGRSCAAPGNSNHS